MGTSKEGTTDLGWNTSTDGGKKSEVAVMRNGNSSGRKEGERIGEVYGR